MALVHYCCCKYSLRRGAYISASYTFIYFFTFITLTLNFIYIETMDLGNMEDNFKSDDDLASYSVLNQTDFKMNWNSTTRRERMSPSLALNITENSILDDIYKEETTPLIQMPSFFVDLFFEVAGMFASISVIIGLYKEKRYYLLPWLIVLPIHTIMDMFNYGYIVATYLYYPEAQPAETNWEVFPTFTVVPGLLFNFINVIH